MAKINETRETSIIKVIYFDEESASDYLDISAGGKEDVTSEHVKKRTNETHGKVEASLMSKLSWLPFLGASGELSAGAGVSAARSSILNKTLSNTILTDYLALARDDDQIVKHRDLRITVHKDSMAYMKMFTPYMVILKMDDIPLDLARLDEVLLGAKGYYELLGDAGANAKCVLRFNINAFRNNYGLTDLSRMRLVFHSMHVGQTRESSLDMKSEMAGDTSTETVTAVNIVEGHPSRDEEFLDVYDVIFAGVEHVK